jgi:hypothetical protein
MMCFGKGWAIYHDSSKLSIVTSNPQTQTYENLQQISYVSWKSETRQRIPQKYKSLIWT